MIVWCLMPFSTVFPLYHGGQLTYPCFPGVLLTSTLHYILSKPLATFPLNHCRTTDSGKRGMNPVAMTIINRRREYWPNRGSNQRPPVLKSTTLPTELWGSALMNENLQLHVCNEISILAAFDLGGVITNSRRDGEAPAKTKRPGTLKEMHWYFFILQIHLYMEILYRCI